MSRFRIGETKKAQPISVSLLPKHIEMLLQIQTKLKKRSKSDVIQVLIEEKFKELNLENG
jgi:hypothetical protein